MSIQLEMTGDSDDLVRAMSRIEAMQVRLEKRFQKVAQSAGRAGDKVRKSATQAFGQADKSISAYASRIVSVNSALTALGNVLQNVHRQNKELAESFRGTADAVGGLAQLARTPGQHAMLTAVGDEIFRRGGADSRSQALNMAFSIESAGLTEFAPQFASMRSIMQDPAMIAPAIAAFRRAMPSQQLDPMSIMSLTLGAGAGSPAQAQELLQAAAPSAQVADEMGFAPASILGATALTSELAGGAAQGGTRVASLVRSLARISGGMVEVGRGQRRRMPDFSGMTLDESLQALEAMDLSTPQMMKALGREEAFLAYSGLTRNREQFLSLTAEAETARETDAFGTRVAIANQDPRVRIQRLERQTLAATELENEQIAQRQSLVDEALARDRARATGATGFSRVMQEIDLFFNRAGNMLDPVMPGDYAEYLIQQYPDLLQMDRGVPVTAPVSTERNLNASGEILRELGEINTNTKGGAAMTPQGDM